MQATPHPSPALGTSRALGILSAALYVALVIAIGIAVQPLTIPWALGIVLLPAASCFILGIPRVLDTKPRGLMALLHLGLYPLAAAITLGLPGVYVAYRVGLLVAG
jgi:hypothetical protein